MDIIYTEMNQDSNLGAGVSEMAVERNGGTENEREQVGNTEVVDGLVAADAFGAGVLSFNPMWNAGHFERYARKLNKMKASLKGFVTSIAQKLVNDAQLVIDGKGSACTSEFCALLSLPPIEPPGNVEAVGDPALLLSTLRMGSLLHETSWQEKSVADAICKDLGTNYETVNEWYKLHRTGVRSQNPDSLVYSRLPPLSSDLEGKAEIDVFDSAIPFLSDAQMQQILFESRYANPLTIPFHYQKYVVPFSAYTQPSAPIQPVQHVDGVNRSTKSGRNVKPVTRAEIGSQPKKELPVPKLKAPKKARPNGMDLLFVEPPELDDDDIDVHIRAHSSIHSILSLQTFHELVYLPSGNDDFLENVGENSILGKRQAEDSVEIPFYERYMLFENEETPRLVSQMQLAQYLNFGNHDDQSALDQLEVEHQKRLDSAHIVFHRPVSDMKLKRVEMVVGRFRTAWLNLIQSEIPLAWKKQQLRVTAQNIIRRKNASIVVKEVCRLAFKPFRLSREAPLRAIKLAKDVVTRTNRYHLQQTDAQYRVHRLENDRAKREEEEKELKRQNRKLEFLLTQTEIFAQFMSRRLGVTSDPQPLASLNVLDATPESSPVLSEEAKKEREEIAAEASSAVAIYIQSQYDAASSSDQGKSNQLQSAVDVSSIQSQLRQPSTVPDAHVVVQPNLFKGSLKSYQLKGLNWLANLYDQGINGILADEMGLGKTVQSIAFLAHLAEAQNVWGPFLVIAPNSTLHQWQNEFSTFCPEFKVLPYWGSPKDRGIIRKHWQPKYLGKRDGGSHVIVTSYSTFLADESYFHKLRWHYLILDEAQAIKNSESQRWKSLLALKCRNRLLLTGTPIQNSMAELWSLLHFIMPSLFDSHAEFADWFSKDIETQAQKSSLQDEEYLPHKAKTRKNVRATFDLKQVQRLHMILKPFMLRRVKKDVENDLPPKVEIQVNVPLSVLQKNMYRALRDKLLFKDLDLIRSDASDTALNNLVMQFRKVCNHPELFERLETNSPFYFNAASVLVKYNHVVAGASPEGVPPLSTSAASIANATGLQLFGVQSQCKSAILFTVPKLLFELVLCNFDGSYGSKISLVYKYFGIWNNLSITRLPSFGFASLIQRSAAELNFEFWSSTNPFVLWLVYLIHRERLQRYSLASTYRPTLNIVGTQIALRQDICFNQFYVALAPTSIETKDLFSDNVIRFQCFKLALKSCSIYLPRVQAPPILPYSSSYRFNQQVSQRLFSPFEMSALNGVDARLFPHSRKCLSSDVRLTRLSFYHYEHASHVGRILSAPSSLVDLAVPICAPFSYMHAVYAANLSSFPSHVSRLEVDSLLFSPNSLFRGSQSLISLPRFGKTVGDSGKLFALDRLLMQLKQNGHRVLIFSQMTQMIDILEDYMAYRKYKYLRFDGSTDVSERRDMVHDFQNSAEYFVFLLSTRAGGLGITLTAADTVIFYDSDWNPTVDAQAQDRAHRIGQTKKVTVYRLICKNTIEQRMLQRAQEKHYIQNTVYSGGFKMSAPVAEIKAVELRSFLLDEEKKD